MIMGSCEANIIPEANKRKRPIEIKKVEEKNRRHVTFSKRKLGLFNKVTELSILCEAETALIVTSQNGKLYNCGYPDTDTVLHRFLADGSSSNMMQQVSFEALRLQYEAIQDQVKEEKKKLQDIREEQENRNCFPSWWNNSIEDMSLDNVEQFKASLEVLKLNLVAAMQEKKFLSVPPNPLATVPPPQLPNMSLLTKGSGENQIQGYWEPSWLSTSSEFPRNGFGHY